MNNTPQSTANPNNMTEKASIGCPVTWDGMKIMVAEESVIMISAVFVYCCILGTKFNEFCSY